MTGDAELAERFEAGRVDPGAFAHGDHVRVTRELLRRYPRDEAYARLVDGLRSLTRRAGRPHAFHETITRAWFELIALDGDAEALQDRGLLGRYYSPAALASGRERWVEPDLHPLALPPPAAGEPAREA